MASISIFSLFCGFVLFYFVLLRVFAAVQVLHLSSASRGYSSSCNVWALEYKFSLWSIDSAGVQSFRRLQHSAQWLWFRGLVAPWQLFDLPELKINPMFLHFWSEFYSCHTREVPNLLTPLFESIPIKLFLPSDPLRIGLLENPGSTPNVVKSASERPDASNLTSDKLPCKHNYLTPS